MGVVDRSTLADIVRELVEKGLLQRQRTKQDARAYAVKLTREGQRVLRAAGPVAKKVEKSFDAPGKTKDGVTVASAG